MLSFEKWVQSERKVTQVLLTEQQKAYLPLNSYCPGAEAWYSFVTTLPCSSSLPEPKPKSKMLGLESQTVGNYNSNCKHLLSLHFSQPAMYFICISSFDLCSNLSRWSFITSLQMGKVRLKVSKVTDKE